MAPAHPAHRGQTPKGQTETKSQAPWPYPFSGYAEQCDGPCHSTLPQDFRHSCLWGRGVHVTYLWSFLSHASMACRQVSLNYYDMAYFSGIPSWAMLTRVWRRAHKSRCSCVSWEVSRKGKTWPLIQYTETIARRLCQASACATTPKKVLVGVVGKKPFGSVVPAIFAPCPKSRTTFVKPSGDP